MHGASKSAAQTILHVIGYIGVFALLSLLLSLAVGFFLELATGLGLLQDEQGRQLLGFGWPYRLGAAGALGGLLWHWLRRS
jgi:hypothetical protein